MTEQVKAQSFPSNVPGMLLGAVLAPLGLFLIATGLAPYVKLVGFFVFLIGVIVFAL